jgi:hypothetical protein
MNFTPALYRLTLLCRVSKPAATTSAAPKTSLKKTNSRAAIGQVVKRAGISNAVAAESAIVSKAVA